MKKILLIDDMKGIRDSLEMILSSKYSLDVVDNAQAGLTKLSAGKYDLIITDIIMPGMDGNEFMLQAKQKSTCPILAISAGGNGVSPNQALLMAKQQAAAILEKPFSKNDLLAKIEQLIN